MIMQHGPPKREPSVIEPEGEFLPRWSGLRTHRAGRFVSPFSTHELKALAPEAFTFVRQTSAAMPEAPASTLAALLGDNVKLHTEIAEAGRQAESALRARDNLVATLAHELRGPLQPIAYALKIMEMQDPAAFQRERQVIERQTALLARLVDDLLDVAHSVRGQVALRRERVGLRTVLASAVEIARPELEARRHRLLIHLPAEDLYLDADLTRLAQVFANLLTNAAHYTPEGGEVVLCAAAEGAQCCTVVKDNGQGIASEALPRVFELFYRGPQEAQHASGGLGIGLALVKSFVGLHGGSVSVRSEGIGHGSEFIVRLPLAHAFTGRIEEDTTASEPI